MSSVRQVPRKAEPGEPGERRLLRLELKLICEVGLIGLPNAGKSTLLSVVSRSRPKIAAYPFTTLGPEVGIAQVGVHETLVIADLPGLIEGAAGGAGLGHRFLRHVERCRVLLHLIDVSEGAEEEPLTALRVIEGELQRFSPALAAKPRLLVATKHFEHPGSQARVEELRRVSGREVLGISSVLGRGLPELLERARSLVRDPDPDPDAL